MSSDHTTAATWTDDDRTVERPLFADAEAALQTTREIVGRKWHPVLLLYLIDDGPLGFSALKDRADGISSKMLSESLSDLEDAGLVTRELIDDQPVRVEYTVSERGATLGPVIDAMVEWGIQEGE